VATFGKTTQGAGTFPINADYKHASKFTLTEPGTITKVSLDLVGEPGGPSNQVMRGVIYADSAGAPGAKLVQSIEVNVPGGSAQASNRRWVDFDCSSPVVNLLPGTYWIGLIAGASDDSSKLGYDSSGDRDFNTDTYSDGASDPFGSPTHDTKTVAAYATYTPYATVTKTLVPAYGILSTVTKSLAASYAITGYILVTKTLVPTYAINAYLTKKLAPTYRVKSHRSRLLSTPINPTTLRNDL
jgi:hypothetical protein